jgi:hypothetical protein
MYSVQINFTGRKSKAGNICFDSGHLGIFVDYCGNCHSKIVMDIDEAERFANKLADEKHRPRNKSLLKAIKKRRF